jgi:hypothetical protein
MLLYVLFLTDFQIYKISTNNESLPEKQQPCDKVTAFSFVCDNYHRQKGTAPGLVDLRQLLAA